MPDNIIDKDEPTNFRKSKTKNFQGDKLLKNKQSLTNITSHRSIHRKPSSSVSDLNLIELETPNLQNQEQ